MKRNIAAIVMAFTMLVVSAMLVACSNSNSSSSSSRAETSSSSNSISSQAETSSSSQSSTPEAEVYAMTENEIPEISYHASYVQDDHGNNIEFTVSRPANDGVIKEVKTMQEFDNFGWVVKQEATLDGAPYTSYESTCERNDKGQVVKVISTQNGKTAETTYEYHDNGMLKSRTTLQPSGANEFEAFDENGYRTEITVKDADGNLHNVNFEWLFDSNGNLTERRASAANSADLVSAGTPEFAKAILDENGNIAEYQNENGETLQRTKWVKIENPSEYVKVFNRLKR